MKQQITNIAMKAMAESSPTTLKVGTVKSVGPVVVEFGPKNYTPAGAVLVAEDLIEKVYTADVEPTNIATHGNHTHTATVTREGLKVGDKVAVIVYNGGQSFFVVDKAVTA
ncbi:DUF2577 family protein [Aureibacillus halotolerans]|uniref:Uncharacterized protein DUF2577 n=1 Tax=Aureibacillus halotolerans TaxID=1508390 RepID=A0A4R6TQR5_9BACI|nr:DUF2577 family protein [Aureibacillus halotolerans]TDQ35289.1 uncharacterized protein DUF2577 [Aureibacillus halotolerans]